MYVYVNSFLSIDIGICIYIPLSLPSPPPLSNLWLIIFFISDPNPHMGHLAWADAFIITADSISMLSEACSTGYTIIIILSSLPPFSSHSLHDNS